MAKNKRKVNNSNIITTCPACKADLAKGGMFVQMLALVFGASFNTQETDVVWKSKPEVTDERPLTLSYYCSGCGKLLGEMKGR